MKILAAYDGSPCSQAAIKDLERAGLPPSAQLLVLTVADVFIPPKSENGVPVMPTEIAEAIERAHKASAQAVEQARVTAEDASQQVRAMFPGWNVEAEAVAGNPGWSIILRAQEWGADLVVVGSHGYSAASRFLLGSVSDKVLEHVHCSVRIVRAPVREGTRPPRLIVGVDGSEDAERAVRAAAARRWPPGSEARIITALDERISLIYAPLLPGPRKWVDTNDQDKHAWVRRMAEAAAATLRESGLDVSTLVLEGDPRELLLREATDWQADCIFVGARGLGALERFLLGSVSSAVAARATCSVEVVRA